MQRFENILYVIEHGEAGELRLDRAITLAGISGFIMGNTAKTILEQIDCSVQAIKPPCFVKPVALED